MKTKTGWVRLTGRLICRSVDDIATIRAHLTEHIYLTRAEPGCISFDVVQSDDPLIWSVDECFCDKAAFDFHQQRTRASPWWSATAQIPRDYQIFGLA
jgi:quinol monooxygenase YgiN